MANDLKRRAEPKGMDEDRTASPVGAIEGSPGRQSREQAPQEPPFGAPEGRQIGDRHVSAAPPGLEMGWVEARQPGADAAGLPSVAPDGALERPDEDHDREDWLRLSALSLEAAYSKEEPEYSLDMLKERNPDHEEPEPQEMAPEPEFEPTTDLERLLWEARREFLLSGDLMLDWDGLEREIAERRGGVSEED